MIVFLAEGRLGNQLFQYAFLKTIQKQNESIVVSGFEELKEIFNVTGLINLSKKNHHLRRLIFKIIRPILEFLSHCSLISSLDINRNLVDGSLIESITYTEKKGFIKNLRYIKLGFYQSEHFFLPEKIENLKIRNEFLAFAQDYFSDIPQEKHKIFVHIRRGDYEDLKIMGKSILLPITYYKEQINYFQKNVKNCFFIFLSDNPTYVEETFRNVQNKKISENTHYGNDFAIMSVCQSGILSPSSFSWWGAYFMKNKHIVFTPKFWLGFNSKKEFPEGSVPSFATEIEITVEEGSVS